MHSYLLRYRRLRTRIALAVIAVIVVGCTPDSAQRQSGETARSVSPVGQTPHGFTPKAWRHISGDIADDLQRSRSPGGGAESDEQEPTVDSWQRGAKLTAIDSFEEDHFGYSVSVSGDLALIGTISDNQQGIGAGAAYVFARDEEDPHSWTQLEKLVASDGSPGDGFGFSVSISGGVALVGAPYDDDFGMFSGAAYVFAKDAGGTDNWGEIRKLYSSEPAAGDEFGRAVSISEEVALVAAPFDDDAASLSGSVSLFAKNAGGVDNWGMQNTLTASDASEDDEFGLSVALNDNLAVIGAPKAGALGSEIGAAYIFARDHGGLDNWGEVQRIAASDGADGSGFGASVAVHAELAIVGAPYAGENGTGAAYVFNRDAEASDQWEQSRKLSVANGPSGQRFGLSVAIEGSTAVVGANHQDYYRLRPSGELTGTAYIFRQDADAAHEWEKFGALTAPDATENDGFASSLSLGGNSLLVGSFAAMHNGEDPGAAYVFSPNHAPLGVDDTATTTRNEAVTVDVLSNDSDADGDPLTISDFTSPTYGSIAQTEAGLTYTPPADFEGTDTFTYTVSDIAGATSSAGVRIIVEAPTFDRTDAGSADAAPTDVTPHDQGCGCTAPHSDDAVPTSTLALLACILLIRRGRLR